MATRINLYIDQGTDFYTTLQLFSADDTDYIITSGIEFYCSVKRLYSSVKLFDADVSIISGDPENDVSLYISADKTENLKTGKYQYDVLMKKNDGSVEKILEGLLFIVETITRAP